VLQAMMKLEQANARAKTANKVALETEKEKDAADKTVEELKRQKCGQLRRRLHCGLDTSGSANLGRFLVA
jgi:hypothetical protein